MSEIIGNTDYEYKIDKINSEVTYPSVSFWYKFGRIFILNVNHFDERNWEETKKEISLNYSWQFFDLLLEARQELLRIGCIVDTGNIHIDAEIIDQMMYDYLANEDELSILALEDYLKEQGVEDKVTVDLIYCVKEKNKFGIQNFLSKYCGVKI